MVTSTKKQAHRAAGQGGQLPGPNGKGPGGNGFKGGGGSQRKFSPATYEITMWVILAAIVMMFAALSSVYIMSSEEQRRPVSMPPMFLVSTGLILASSWTFQRAKRSLQQQPHAHMKWLLITLGLGCGFLVSQLIGWRELANAGVYFAEHPRSTFFYLGTALHGAHLLGGIGLVSYLVIRSRRHALRANAEQHSTWTAVVGRYWHTMDGIWLWLFLLLLIFK